MSSSKSVVHPLSSEKSLRNGSPTGSVGSENPLLEDTAELLEKTRRAASPNSKKDRLSLVAPRREKGKEIAREEEPWGAKNVLSFDGGGIRGLYSLLILQLLMNNIRFFEKEYVDGTGTNASAPSSFHPAREPRNVSHILQKSIPDNEQEERSRGNFLPCHYFDYICGTSTGGLIAIMLGRLRMSVDDCIAEYQQLAGGVFGNPRTFHQISLPTFWIKRPKYDAINLEAIIKRVVNRRGEISADNIQRDFHTGQGMCRTFVFAYKKTGHDDTQRNGTEFEQPYIFRSYNHYQRTQNGSDISQLRNPGDASPYLLWQIARATTAAPLFFAPMQVTMGDESSETREFGLRRAVTGFLGPRPPLTNSRPITFIDGGFGPANNPSKEAYFEVTLANESIGTLVSIGTGRGSADKFHTRLLKFVKANLAAVGDPQPADVAMKAKSKREGFEYFRFNEHDGLPDIEFDEWKPRATGAKTQQKIREAFHRLSVDPRITEDIRRCALDLVRRRRLRTADESRWERYATKSHFDCKEEHCLEPGDKRWYGRDEFRDHLRHGHKCMEEDAKLEEIIDTHRTTWRYKSGQVVNGGAN